MYYSSYYDRIGKLLKTNENNDDNKDNELENIRSLYKVNRRIHNLIIKREKEELEPEYLYFKLKEDMPKLEKYIQDSKYRKELEQNSEIGYLIHENYELMDLYGLEKKVKEKLKIPENATIKYENIKCSKCCRHKHKYFYAYFWDSKSKKLKKKYIGKHLPLPFNFSITCS